MTIRTSIAASLMALLLAVGAVAPASAQPDATATDSIEKAPWTEHLGEQARVLLETGDPERQEDAVRYVLLYARRSDVNVDFEPAVPALFEIYENAENEGLRLMALSALNAIGGEPVMTRLAEQVRFEQSDRVRHHALRMLKIHLQRKRGDTVM